MPSIITRGAVSALAYGWASVVKVLDPYFKYVTMLLPGNGTNGAQNNTFLDSSTNNFSITRNGNTTQGTFTPYGSNWSNYLNGSSSLTTGTGAALNYGTGDFTIECWFNLTAKTSGQAPITQLPSVSDGAWRLSTQDFSGVDKVQFVVRVSGAWVTVLDIAQTWNIGTWYHLALSRSGTTLRAFVNGTQVGTNTTFSSTLGSNTYATYIGYNAVDTVYFSGYVSNARTIKGGALYTANFTPSTTPLTTTVSAGTVSLLTCQSNRFIDNSANAFTLTVGGTPSVQVFSPFSPSAAYSTTTIGGSGYFDGTGDYLSVADSATLELGSSDFCIEGWYYPTTFAANLALVSKRTNTTSTGAIVIYANSGAGSLTFYASTNGSSYFWSGATVGTLVLNQWNHFAVYRSGNNWYGAVNGTVSSMGSSANSIYNNTDAWTIGGDTNGNYANGYMSNVRFVIGSAVYTSANFTPPTAPLTAITNTQLLANMTNAGIIDNAMMNDLETVGNAQISTTQSKFGGGSIAFDGTGDILQAPQNQIYAFGTGDFTIEFWVYPNSWTATASTVVRIAGSSDWVCQFDGSGILNFYNGATTVLTDTASPSTGTWTHFAIVRSGSTMKLYRNGTSTVSATHSSSVGCTNVLLVGCGGNSNNTLYCLNGYMDDLRITKGYARYTANFTAPTAAFPTQ